MSTANASQQNKKIDGVEVCLEDDPYLIELHKRLVEARNERKVAETQCNMLGNRLNLLRGEEEKSIKEVENIKYKYKKKYDTIKQIEKDLKQKIEFKQLREEELEKQKSYNLNMRSEITNKIKDKREEHVKELFKEMVKLKELKKQNDELTRHIKLEEQNTNKNKYEFQKNQKSLCDEKKRAKQVCYYANIVYILTYILYSFQIEKKNQTRENLENKILEEKNLKERIEEKNKKLGEEEIDIMKKIKTTTKVHQIWITELEKIDKQKSELANQYKTKLKGYKKRDISLNFNQKEVKSKKDKDKCEDDYCEDEKKSEDSAENTTKKYKIGNQSPKKAGFIKNRLSTIKDDDIKEKENEIKENKSGKKEDNISFFGNKERGESKAFQILEKIRQADRKGEIEKIDPMIDMLNPVVPKNKSSFKK